MLPRVLIIVAALYLIWRVLSARGRRMARTGAGADDFSRFSGKSRERRMRQRRQQAEQLIPCANCGVFIPEDTALPAGSLAYCSERCREVHTRQSA